MVYDSLKEAGLTEGEIKVYVSLLKLGPSTSGAIVDASGVSRSIIYNILDRLSDKGLVTHIIRDKTKRYEARDPTQIRDYLDKKQSKLDKTKEDVEELIPKLLEFRENTPNSRAQIYSGFKGVQSAHERTYLKLKKGEEYYYLGVFPEQSEKYQLYWQRDHKRRAKSGIKCRLLYNQGTDKGVLKNRNSYKGGEARYMDSDVKTPAWIMGYKDTTLIGLQDAEFAIEIVNQKIADSFKEYFEHFWKESKKFKG